MDITFTDTDVESWRFDLATGAAGPDVAGAVTCSITADVASFSLLAAARRSWRDLDGIAVDGPDPAAGAALLDLVRVV